MLRRFSGHFHFSTLDPFMGRATVRVCTFMKGKTVRQPRSSAKPDAGRDRAASRTRRTRVSQLQPPSPASQAANIIVLAQPAPIDEGDWLLAGNF
jgi:hypothetical protein